jgi:chemosensory pili system protein ChpC
MSGNSAAREVRGVLLPLQSGQLLLPHMTLSEVIGYRAPEVHPERAPDWLLGVIEWRRSPVPLVSYEMLAGGVPDVEIGHRARIAICRTLNDHSDRPYTGILLRAIPRLIRVTEELIAPIERPDQERVMVARQVWVGGQEAWIPDLDALEQALAEVLEPEQSFAAV